MGKIYQVVVNGAKGEKLTIDLCNTEEQFKSMTVLQLKERIAEKLPGGNLENQRLIFAATPLDEDTKTLSSYEIQHQSLLQLVIKLPGGLPG